MGYTIHINKIASDPECVANANIQRIPLKVALGLGEGIILKSH